MEPPYRLSPQILSRVVAISEKIGEVRAYHLSMPSPRLRKAHQIRSIRASLAIEGNTLSEEQITALLKGKRVIGPPKDIREAQNALNAYEKIATFLPNREEDFLRAHRLLMEGLVDAAGKYRRGNVGILQSGQQLSHLAPPARNIPTLMAELFGYLHETDEIPLIKSCVFHYELEFIHPFTDGNGRMGRLWQTRILMEYHPIFAFLPIETLISESQKAYYQALSASDKAGASTPFIDYMLEQIQAALELYLMEVRQPRTTDERLLYFIREYADRQRPFFRKDYQKVFRDISSSTASRDLQHGVEKKWLRKEGDKRTTRYHILKQPE